MYKKTVIFGFLHCLSYALIVYLGIDSILYMIESQPLYPENAETIADLVKNKKYLPTV